MICINPNRPDFRQLAEYHGVSVNKLEMITYKYRQMTGIEDAFPSELFIKSELGNIPYVEDEPKVIELYNLNPNRYAPKEFSSADEAYAASEDFKKQGFPDQAFVVYPNYKEGYTLAVRKPIKDFNVTVEDILKKQSSNPQDLLDFALIKENNDNFAQNLNQEKHERIKRHSALRGDDSRGISQNSPRAIQARRDLSNIQALTDGLSNEQGRDTEISEKKLQQQESERLIETARHYGLFIPKEQYKDFGERVKDKTGESTVFKKGNTYFKIKDPYAKQPIKNTRAKDVIYEHIIHNLLFPTTSYIFEGISEELGDVRIILSQQEVESHRHPTDQEIIKYLEEILHLKQEDAYTWGNDNYSITDVGSNSDNVLLGEDNQLYFIDPLIKLKKPANEIINILLKAEQADFQMSLPQNGNQSIPASYKGMITPDANTIFVFGSNSEGRHGAGAAKVAREQFGAVYGQGEGLQGNSYALPTKELRSKPLYSENGGKTPVTMYRGYALTEDREAYNIEETVGKTAVDYDESLKGALYFTSSKEEAQDYANGRTDRSPEPPTQENPQGRPVNRHYTGDYAKVSKYFIASDAKVEHYKDIRDYIKNGRNSNADVIVLDKGTAFSDNTEYIVKNPSVIVYDKMLRSITPEQITENIRKMYEVARQNPSKQFKVAYTNGLNEATRNGYTGAEMIQMFKDAGPIPSNVIFSKNWTDHWNEVQPNQQEASPDINPEHPTLTVKEQEVINQQLDDYDRINQQIDKLNDDAILSSTEVRHAAELVFNALSDMVTEIQQNKGRAQELFPSLNTELDFQTATRKQIIETIGIGRLLEGVKTKYFDTEHMSDEAYANLDPAEEQELNEIFDNWDGVLTFGTDIFALNEGFGIRRNRKEGRYELTNGMHLGFESLNGHEDPDSIREQEDEQDHWQVEQRTIDIVSSATELVRQAIHGCYLLNSKGENISKYGINERVEPRKAIQSILTWTIGSQSIKEMVSRLKTKEKNHTWLTQLINRLNDSSGSEADFQSQFFNTMCKSYQSYAVGIKEDGSYAVIPVNDHPAASDILDNIEGMYQAGAHALFQGTEKKVDIKYLGTADKVSENDPFTLHKALHELQQIKDAHFNDRNEEPLTEEEQEKIKSIISGVCKILGFEPSEEIVAEAVENKYDVIGFGKYEMEDNRSSMLKSLGYIVDNLDKAYKKQREGNKTTYTPFKYRAENGIKSDITNFLRPITDIMDETVPNVVYNDGKLYQGYVTPSYLTLLFEKFHWEGERFNEFIENTYGKSEWFFDKNGDARTPWLEDLTSANGQRMQFKHRVELNFNKHAYMKRMSPEEYTVSLITHYFSEYNWNDNKDRSFAWFRVPMQSNKPSSEFIRFYAETGGNYKDRIADGLFKVFMQEVSRIQTVGMRALSKEDLDYINNWDKLGKKFCFLPFLNDYIEDGKTGNLLEADNDRLSELLKKLVNREKLSNEDSSTLNSLVIQAIKNYNEQRANQILDAWETSGIIEEAVNVKNIMPENIAKATGEEANAAKKDFVRKQLENYIWNDHYAAINILELTIGDVAAYKNADDLQKRLAELHAPGVRPNIYATDYGDPDNGIAPHRVSDGIHRTVILEDWEDFKSNIIENISEICDRKIEAAPESQKKALRAWKEYLVGKDGVYRNINVADAQAFSSPSSYRKKALMFGRWSRKAEEVYQKLMSGDYNMTDLETAFQPLKPFVYGQIMQDVGIKGDVNSPIQTMPIPFQAKNAEYLLVMADAIIRGAEKNGIQTGKPNFLRAIYNVMEESERLNPTRGIDTVQFKSAIKSGLQGALNIHQFIDSPNGETDAYTELRGHIYKRDASGNLTSEYNTRTYVKEIDYSSYCLQQEVPDHFKNHSQAQGSQERMIIPSDLDAVDMFGNTNMYTWTDPDGTVRNEPASVVRKEYEETIADNINTDVEVLRQQLGLPIVDAKTGNIIYAGLSKKERNIALSKILQEEIEDSPRYGTELFQACQVDKATGNFRIPLGDPVQAKRIVQLLNSIIKNRVNKQEIAGGPVVQVSNFGTSRQLKIRFNARSGGLLKLESEFTPTAKYKTYDEYKKAEQAGIAYFEVFAPAWSNDIFKYFTDSEGNVDITALELVDPDLLKMISYRIPTEDKYSIAPMKVVGFLPKEAGSAVMFPYELTGIDGSDYDVDKRYIIRKVIEIAHKFDLHENESISEAEKEYIENNRESIIAHLRDAIKLTANTTKEERDKAIEEAELTAASKRRAAERVHEENLDKIERRNSMMEDAEANVTFSANKEKDDEIYEKRDAKVEKSYNKAIEKENEQYKAKLAKIESEKDKDIVKNIEALERKKVTGRIIRFLKVDRLQSAEYDDALTRELRKAYLDYMFKPISYAKGKYANDNKIFEMTWGVLTNEMTADKILNPGGFDNFKKLAYLTAAYKAGKGSWNELNEKSISELKDLANENKDLTFIDTQIQFYKQNAAAASLIGVFAVHKIAHAVLEGNGIYIDVDEICETDKPFTIDGFTFDGRMEIDPKENSLGELIGKILGSGVGASADAVKDPCLDLLNINMTTINILNTAIRMSMPLESITKLLSQDVITRLLAEYNRRNLGGYVQLDDVINEWLDDAREELQITEGSSIEYEDLTGEELIQGLRPDNNNVRTEYKTLLAFQRLKLLADKMRNPTFVTRFNSISSATGPQVVDNLITEQKIKDFTWNGEDSTGFYTAEGDTVDVNTILNDHPILKAFAQAYDIAEELFSQIPEGSNAFKATIINGEEGLAAHGILSKVMRDKKLFDKLVNFYTTYLMVQAGLINPNEEATVNNKKVSKLEWYINEFPTVFLNKYKEKYKDNAFIQAISSQTSKKSNRTFLRIPLTGMEEQDKAKLRAAWTDLHKIDPDLSIRLATYWIFRGGIGFSPKTGTAVIPNYVKEHWSVKRSDGSTITYNDVYRMLESVVPDVVIDQFIRNNWNDNKLVPKKRGSKDSYHYSYKNGVPATLRVTGKKAIADIGDSIWIKTPFKNGTYLWKLISSDADALYFRRVMPLGDNNEYLEMSTENIEKPLSNTTMTIEDEDQTEIQETSTPNYDSEGNSVPPVNKAKEGRKYTKMAEIVYDYYTNVKKTSGYTMERAQSAVNDYRSEDGRLKQIYGPSMMEALRHAGVKVDESTLEETVEKYCM